MERVNGHDVVLSAVHVHGVGSGGRRNLQNEMVKSVPVMHIAFRGSDPSAPFPVRQSMKWFASIE